MSSTRTNYATIIDAIKATVRDYGYIHRRDLVKRVCETTQQKNNIRVGVIADSLATQSDITGIRQRNNRFSTCDTNVVSKQEHDRVLAEVKVKMAELDAKEKQVQEALEAANQKLKDATVRIEEVVVEVVVKQPRKKPVSTTGLFHKQFKRILQLAQARRNIFLYGPTGCGKSHICAQVAEALGLPFAFISCSAGMSEGQVGGRLLPTGKGGQFEYVISEFVKAYEEGGVFLLDEIDAADPNVLLFINAALANGKVALANRPANPYAYRHKDFVCVAAANTVGTGADRMYSGRNKLDGATLDRFQIGKVLLGYDERVEEELAKQICEKWEVEYNPAILERCWKIRKAIMENRLERAMSTRFIIDAYEMACQFEWSNADFDAAFFAGWRAEEIQSVRQEVADACID